MKTFRYRIVILTILLMGMGTGVQAQDDERALGAATDTICRIWGVTKKQYVYRIVEKVFEDHPTASFATRIAKAFYSYNENSETHVRDFHISDTVAAFRYIRRSIELDPKYAEAYVVASDILDYDRKDDEAMRWLDEGVKHNPSDPSLYMAQAKLLAVKDEQGAVAKIEEIRKHDPKFPVDLELARMYYKLMDRGGSSQERVAFCEKMVGYYGKASINDMNAGDLGAYALGISVTLAYHNELRDKWYEISTYGVQKFPEDLAMRKYLLYACRSCEKWDEGIVAGNTYFSMIDSTKIQALDYIHYGTCLRSVKRYDEAIAQYEKALNMDNTADYMKRQAENNIALAISAQVNEYSKNGEYDKAVATIEPYVAKYNAQGKQNDNLILAYGDVCKKWGDNLEGTEQEEKWRKADKIYVEGTARSQLNKAVFALRRYVIAVMSDKNAETGAAVPVMKEIENVIDQEALKDPDLKKQLYNPYRYLRAYYTNSNNYAAAIEYAEKILDIDPTDQGSLQVIAVFSKKVKR